MDIKPNIIFRTTDTLDRIITLDSQTWNDHVIMGHPEMSGNEAALKETIENPDFVYGSGTNPKRELYFAKQKNSTFPSLYTRAVVEFNGSQGTVTTAFFCKEIQGVNPEAIKYVKPKI